MSAWSGTRISQCAGEKEYGRERDPNSSACEPIVYIPILLESQIERGCFLK